MLAVIAAVLFALALILELASVAGLGVISVAVLTTAGLLCIALHLSGVGASTNVFSRRR